MTSKLSDWIDREAKEHDYWPVDFVAGYKLGLGRGFKEAAKIAFKGSWEGHGSGRLCNCSCFEEFIKEKEEI